MDTATTAIMLGVISAQQNDGPVHGGLGAHHQSVDPVQFAILFGLGVLLFAFTIVMSIWSEKRERY